MVDNIQHVSVSLQQIDPFNEPGDVEINDWFTQFGTHTFARFNVRLCNATNSLKMSNFYTTEDTYEIVL